MIKETSVGQELSCLKRCLSHALMNNDFTAHVFHKIFEGDGIDLTQYLSHSKPVHLKHIIL